jgi:hypothetical protein
MDALIRYCPASLDLSFAPANIPDWLVTPTSVSHSSLRSPDDIKHRLGKGMRGRLGILCRRLLCGLRLL